MKSMSVKVWRKVLNVTTAATLGAFLISAVVALHIVEPLPMMATIDSDHVLHTSIHEWEFRESFKPNPHYY